MFGRVLKYDFRSMLKQFALIWPAALALSLINRFTVSGIGSTSQVGETTAGIAMFVYVAILIAMFVITVIFIIQRFYKGLLGDEGYLMHTLPVRPWQLIGSKLLTAVVTTLLSIVVAVVSIVIVATWDLHVRFVGFGRAWDILVSNWGAGQTHAILILVEFFLFICVGMAASYANIYLAMAIGHLFNKHRVAFSVAAFIGIDVVASMVMQFLFEIGFTQRFIDFLARVTAAQDWGGIHGALWILIAHTAVVCAIYFLGTEYILRRKLNLE